MKIIKTAVKASLPVLPNEVMPSEDETLDLGIESDQFTSIMLTTDGFKAILENAKLPDELFQLMVDRFNIIPKDKGVAVGIVGNWLVEQMGSFTEQQLNNIADGIDINQIARLVLETKIDGIRVRSGFLSPRHYIPLIGESKHANLKKFSRI